MEKLINNLHYIIHRRQREKISRYS